MASPAELLVNDLVDSTLASSATATDTTLTLTTGQGSRYPAPAANQAFRIRVDNELMAVTGVSGDVLTVTRNIENTTAATHASGAKVSAVLTAGGLARWAALGILPRYHNLLAWNFDPMLASSTAANTGAGQRGYYKVPIHEDMTVTAAGIYVATGGTGATALANCFLGLYDASGTRLGVSADQSTAWATVGFKSAALTADAAGSLNLSGGPDSYVYVGEIVGTMSTTAVGFARNVSGSSGIPNLNLSGASLRAGVNGSGQTTLPATFTPSGLAGALPLWVCLL